MPSKVSPHSREFDTHERLVEIRKRRKIVVYERVPEKPNGDTLFFFHGAGGTYRQFKKQMTHFVGLGYRIVAHDMYGHGMCTNPVRAERNMFTFEQYCYDALSLFDRYRTSNKNVLIGHSYGTSLCTLVYNERSRQITKLVMISGGGPFALAPEKHSVFSLPSSILSCFKPLIIKIFREACFHSSTQKTLLPDGELLSIDMYQLSHVMHGQRWDAGDEAYHALIAAPTLLLVGLHDKFIAVEDEIVMNFVIPNSILHVLEGGHMLPIDCPDEVNEIISSFLVNSADLHSTIHAHTICKKPAEEDVALSETRI